MRYVIALIAVIVLIGPVVWASLSSRGRVTNCCAPADPQRDVRMGSAFPDGTRPMDGETLTPSTQNEVDRQH